MGMKAVILAGGKGSRLAPYTTVLPKPLMPIVDMPILEIVLNQLKRCGFTDIVIAVGHLASLIKAYFGDGSGVGIRIEYIFEATPLGTAGPLGNIEGLDETFLVMNGDILTDLDYAELVDQHKSGGSMMTIATYRRKVKIDFGVLETESGYVSEYIEKPTLDYLVSMGVYVMEPEVRRHIKKDEYLDLPDLVRLLLASGEKVRAYPFEGRWLDIGRQEDFLEAQARFEENRDQFLK
jgi:NDP-mannose synthase